MAEESSATRHKISKTKTYISAFGIFLLVNFAVEAGITFLENATHQWLYPIFPYTRIGLLIITILVANYYIRHKLHKPKQKLWWRILKPILVIIVMFGLAIGAMFSITQADIDRTNSEIEKAQEKLQGLEVPTSQPPTNNSSESVQ